MKLYTEEQVREMLSNMLLTREQVESILKELKPLGELKQSPEHIKPGMITIKQGSTQDTPAIEDTIKNLDNRIKELEKKRSNSIMDIRLK